MTTRDASPERKGLNDVKTNVPASSTIPTIPGKRRPAFVKRPQIPNPPLSQQPAVQSSTQVTEHNKICEGLITRTRRFAFVYKKDGCILYYIQNNKHMNHRFDESCKYFQYDEKQDSIYYCSKEGHYRFTLSTGLESPVLCLQNAMDSSYRYNTIYTGKYTDDGNIPEGEDNPSNWYTFQYSKTHILCDTLPKPEWTTIYERGPFRIERKKIYDWEYHFRVYSNGKMLDKVITLRNDTPNIWLTYSGHMLIINDMYYVMHDYESGS